MARGLFDDSELVDRDARAEVRRETLAKVSSCKTSTEKRMEEQRCMRPSPMADCGAPPPTTLGGIRRRCVLIVFPTVEDREGFGQLIKVQQDKEFYLISNVANVERIISALKETSNE